MYVITTTSQAEVGVRGREEGGLQGMQAVPADGVQESMRRRMGDGPGGLRKQGQT